MKHYDLVVEEVRRRGMKFTSRFGDNPKRIFKTLQKMANKNFNKQVNEIQLVAVTRATKADIGY